MEKGEKYLITCDERFYAPDGRNYRAVWGSVEIFEDNALGVKTNRNSTNWYLKVGDEENHVIIAGCRVHYAVKCDKRPNAGQVWDYFGHQEKGVITTYRPSEIYIAEK